MKRRRGTRIPVLSMLDLLLGTFGAMIVIAVLLTFLRTQEPRINQSALYFVMIQIKTKLPQTGADLSQVFIDFQFIPAAHSAPTKTWSPLGVTDTPATAHGVVHAVADKDVTASSIRVPIQMIRDAPGGRPRLVARLQNLPSLRFDQGAPLNAALEFRISMVIQTAYNACAVEQVFPLSSLLAADAASEAQAPSVFSILAVPHGGKHLICTFDSSANKRGATFEVDDGELLLELG